MKHTPGPWEHAVEKDGSVVVFEAVTLKNTDICLMTDIPEDVANARLIAAAPDLLIALKTALPQLIGPAYGKAIDAINKAEGRS